jgi:hypothetical protein
MKSHSTVLFCFLFLFLFLFWVLICKREIIELVQLMNSLLYHMLKNCVNPILHLVPQLYRLNRNF